MGDSNTGVSAYTMYRHLHQYCSHPSILLSICQKSTKKSVETQHTQLHRKMWNNVPHHRDMRGLFEKLIGECIITYGWL